MTNTVQELTDFFKREFPQALEKNSIEKITDKGAETLYWVDESDLRPGQTISGPTLMMVADLALYVAIMGQLGLVSMAVTTNMTINFFRRPNGTQNIKAICRLIKVGKTVVTGDVWL